GTPVAHVLARVQNADTEPRGEILQLYVDPDHWGRSYGRTLLAVGTRALHRSGCDTAELWVLDGNNRAIDLYERAGWQLDGRREVHVVFGIDAPEIAMSTTLTGPDVVRDNRAFWDDQAAWYATKADAAWSRTPRWGIFGIDDADVSIFPDVADLDVVELGCGTGYVSGWALATGARSAVGIDNSPKQLATAQAMAAKHERSLPFVHGDAHRLPFADRSFDVAINEYGAAIWCDPHIWIPEAARVLRPGGLLWFLGNSVQLMLCMAEFWDEPAGTALRRPLRGLGHMTWLDTADSEFHVSHGEMISILTRSGFAVEALHELYAPEGATSDYGFVGAEWGSQWPVEEVWVARRR
ncbi:MAG: GNAT family N-acetyltransferase, partial [Acidimicrobiales bacterium]|nr:GNAT family N-acetyltransferase [Acidimicrobiales bacterium]